MLVYKVWKCRKIKNVNFTNTNDTVEIKRLASMEAKI